MNFVNKIKKLRHKLYISKFRHSPICENKIILWADSFKHFGCSPKYIALYLLKNYPNKFDIVWVFDSAECIPTDLPKKIRTVQYCTIEYLMELHTAKFIICNKRITSAYHWKKRPEQIYIQTWHSSLRLKKIEGDAISALGEGYIRSAQNDSRLIDVLLSGCRFSTEIFRKSFWYDGKILEIGTPRCDILFNNSDDTRRRVFDFYNIPYDSKLILYAPTFRNGYKADTMGIDFPSIKSVLDEETNDNWVVGCRLHPNILEDTVAEDSIIMTKYSDMQELICAADILITDYSSCMFDMAVAGKPCILYTPDLDKYTSDERGLYFDIMSLPFPVARNNAELCETLATFDIDVYNDELSDFMKDIGSYEDGNATRKVADYILDIIK